ncbi:MAG: hypothetical protein GTO63_15775 [Anaerolineae bacterium]|nr:hypothetical protein [Anaerolineae bacterium]NIN96288.1 hypothetical protein [Anaerolineae bacterium]NIQ79308.1 hypothetical protein [Anaerolineae bacterium]
MRGMSKPFKKKKKKKSNPWDPDYVDPTTGEKVWEGEKPKKGRSKKPKKKRPSDVTDEAEETAEDLKKRNKRLRDLYGEAPPAGAQREGLK